MQKISLYITVIYLTALVTSCEKEIEGYAGEEGVYFSVQHGNPTRSETTWPYQPYSPVDFVRIGQEEVDFTVKVAITGPRKDYDRIFHLEVNPDSTTAIVGQHYEPLSRDWIIPASALSTYIKVRLKRTSDLEETPRKLGLRLVPSKDLGLSFPEWDAIPALNGGDIVAEFDASQHSLLLNDAMTKPTVWSGSVRASDNRETGPLGAFSRKKMEFLIDNLGVKYEDFSSAETMPMARIMLISKDAAAILIKRFNEKDPVLEDDKRLMYFESVPWFSNVGVPYVPAP